MMGRRRNGIRGLRYDLPDGRRGDGRYRLAALHRNPVDTAVNAGAQYAVNNAGMVSSGSSTPQHRDFEPCKQFERHGLGDQHRQRKQQQRHDWLLLSKGNAREPDLGKHRDLRQQLASGGGIGGQFVTITANRRISPIFTAFGFVSSGWGVSVQDSNITLDPTGAGCGGTSGLVEVTITNTFNTPVPAIIQLGAGGHR
jgi:hypothetical protein